MKYLHRKESFDDVHIGDRVLLLSDEFGMSAGSFGRVKSKFRMTEMVTIEWDDLVSIPDSTFRKTDELQLSDLKFLAFEGELVI